MEFENLYDELYPTMSDKHLFCIANRNMYTDANLWQTHNQGYEPDCIFNYGFVNVGSQDTEDKDWLPLKGNIIEYWHIPSGNIRCVELRANDDSYGIRQRLMDFATKDYIDSIGKSYAEGFYLITWKDRARLGDNGSEVGNAYSAYVTIGNPEESTQTIENNNDITVLASVNIANDALSQSQWRNRGMIVRVKRADEFNSQSAHIWLSFKNTNNSTFGTLITDVDVHALRLWSDDYEIFPYEDTTDDTLGIVDGRNTDSIAWIQAHDTENNPQMPYLSLGDFPTQYKITAQLEVNYERESIDYREYDKGQTKLNKLKADNTETINKDKVTFDANDWSSLEGGTWDISCPGYKWDTEITTNGFFGGDATLTLSFIAQNGDGADFTIECDEKFKFRIAGQNPDDAICKNYIIGQLSSRGLSDMAWCMPAVAKHESFGYGGRVTSYHPFVWVRDGNVIYNQFRAGGGHRSETPTLRVQGEEGIPLWCRAGSETGAGGYGILQVTGNSSSGKYYAIPRAQIWNWQENVKAGLDIIKTKYDIADDYLKDQLNQSNVDNVPEYTVKSPSDGSKYNFTFTDTGDKKMLHLLTLKAYNGAGRGYMNETAAKNEDQSNNIVRSGNFVLCPPCSGHYCSWISSYNSYNYNFTNRWVIAPYVTRGSIETDYVHKVLSMVNFAES